MNEDISGHDSTTDMASTPNAAELNAALPQLLSTSTIAFDAFDDLDINQTNFSELDEEEQDIAHIILSDPSLLGLDCLVGAGPPKNRAQGVANAEQELAFPTFDFAQLPSAGSSTSGRAGAAFDAGAESSQANGATMQRNGTSSTYGHRPLPSAMSASSIGRKSGDENTSQSGTHTSMGSRVGSRSGSPPKASTKPPTMRKACDLCHQAKQKCSGERPTCERCKVGGWPCHYAVRARRRTPVSNRANIAPAPPSHFITGGIKAPLTFRSMPLESTSMAPRVAQCPRPMALANANSGSSTRPQSVAPEPHPKLASRSILPPAPPPSNQQSSNSTAAPTPASIVDTKQTINSTQTVQPRFRSIAGPIKAGMPNFGQFSANAFLAKKFPGLMPGASRPIISPGQLPYMSKAAALSGIGQETASSPNQQKRPSKKRKTKNGGGVASAEAENNLNVMDGFGYLYGFQDTGSNNPEPANHGYHGPVGWAPSQEDQFSGTTPREEQILSDRWQANMRLEGEPELRPEDYLQIIREDSLLADLDFERHLLTLAPKPIGLALHQDFSPSHTQTSDDVLQDVASILDPQFTHHSGATDVIKAEDNGTKGANSVASHPFDDFADADEEVLRLIRQEFGHSEYDISRDAQQNASATTDIKSSGDGSMTDLDAGMFGDGDHVNTANLSAFSDQFFSETFSSHDSQRSEASSVYHDSGEAVLPDFMMEDLTDFAAWSAQAEQPLVSSKATSQFGTNPQQSPVTAFRNPQDSGLAIDVAGLDDLIQLNAKTEEEQFALDVASMFPDPEDVSRQVNQSSTAEDIIMDSGPVNIAELEQALQQHADLTNTSGHDVLTSPRLQPKLEVSDTPLSTSHMALPAIDTLDELEGESHATPVSLAHTTTPAFAEPLKPACQHEADISQIVRALFRLGQPTTTLGQLMPHLTRSLETLASLPVCQTCAVNPNQTIPQLALLSRTCSILMRPHPLTPSPLPLVIAGGRTTFTGLAPEIEVHIIDILWANWRSHSLQKVFHDLGQRVHQHANECARKRHEQRKNISPSVDGENMNDGPTSEELRCDMMTLALKRFRTKVR